MKVLYDVARYCLCTAEAWLLSSKEATGTEMLDVLSGQYCPLHRTAEVISFLLENSE